MAHILLIVHSYVRWLVLLAALVAVARAVSGVATGRSYGVADAKSALFFMIAMDTQFLLGVVLYGVSPLMREAMRNMGASMADAPTRFFVAEHPTFMLLALVLVHVGRVLIKRAELDRAKFVRSAVSFAAATGLILAGIPWWRLAAV
ncbi:MAG: hypothetical protein NTZ43_09345 [Gemmatimonadetes bacterium]|nr:hypothetical protein [Gemmatimonadota bacterium]